MSAAPPKVSPILQIGFTGHRNLSGADPAQLQKVLDDLLAAIKAAARAALAQGWPGLDPAEALSRLELRGLTALAIGADCIAARAILGAGWPLVAPLPFAREIYRDDFTTDADKADYDALLARAVTVYELDGVAGRSDAYRAVGRLILEQSDILVAVWDGAVEHGPGGTGEVVREARATDIPVVVIDPKPPHAIHILASAGAGNIADIVAALLAPPRKNANVDGLGLYYKESRRDAPRLAAKMAGIERWLLAFRPKGASPPATPEPVPGAEAADGPFAVVQTALMLFLEAADQLAVRYATLYRASISLKWLAVFPSAFAALILLYVQAPWAAPLSIVAQLVSAITFLIGFNDRHSGWHRRFLDYRFMAEHLRYAPLMGMFGSTSTLPRLPPYQAAVDSDWVNWYLRFTLRQLGLVPARRDAAFLARMRQLLTAQIEDQIAFYTVRSADAQLLAKRLQFATMLFYFAAWGLGMLGSLVKFWGITSVTTALQDTASGGFTTALSILFLLAASATVFGMIWPAISGFRAQREYFRLSQRYDAMVRQLRQLEARLARDGGAPGQVERVAREAVEAMLSEVSDWRVLIKARDFSPY